MDRQWCTTKYATLIQQQSADRSREHAILLPNKGFRDHDGCSSYPNSVMQCLLHYKAVRKICFADSSKSLKQLVSDYENIGANVVLDWMDVCNEVGIPFDLHDQQDPVTYLAAIVTK